MLFAITLWFGKLLPDLWFILLRSFTTLVIELLWMLTLVFCRLLQWDFNLFWFGCLGPVDLLSFCPPLIFSVLGHPLCDREEDTLCPGIYDKKKKNRIFGLHVFSVLFFLFLVQEADSCFLICSLASVPIQVSAYVLWIWTSRVIQQIS